MGPPRVDILTPAITAQLDPHEERERDILRSAARRQLGSPAQAGARIALAICEIEAGLRSPLQLEHRCHLTLWPKLAARLRRSGGPAVPVGSLIRVIAQEHVPGLAEVTVLVRGDHAALDAAIDACLARTDRTLYIRWRAISFLVRVRYEHQPTLVSPTGPSPGRTPGRKGRAWGAPRVGEKSSSQNEFWGHLFGASPCGCA